VGRPIQWVWAFALAAGAAACDSGAPRASDAAARGDGPTTATGADAEGSAGPLLTGSPDGAPFANAAAFVIETPDDESTTVIYVFSRPVRCIDLSFAGWDTHLPGGTTFLELKVSGHAPGTVWAVQAEQPAAGQVVVTYARPFAGGGSREVRASGGTVTLAAVAAHGPASLSLSLTFGAHSLTGDLAALFCPGGHEP
jgi:hypothetical protein